MQAVKELHAKLKKRNTSGLWTQTWAIFHLNASTDNVKRYILISVLIAEEVITLINL